MRRSLERRKRFYDRVTRVAERLRPAFLARGGRALGDSTRAEDAYQDTILAVLQAAPDLRSDSVTEWYLLDAFRTTLNHHRARWIRWRSHTTALDEASYGRLPATEASAELRLIGRERLAGLPPRLAAVADLHIQGFTGGQIGERLGVTERTVRNRLCAIHKLLDQGREDDAADG